MTRRELAWALGVGLVATLAVLLGAGLPPEDLGGGVLLGSGPELPRGPWGLWYVATQLLTQGLETTLISWPTGGRLWPGPVVEGLVLAPLTWAAGPGVAWNLLVLLRVVAAGAGGALLLAHLGLRPAWGLALGLSPALLQALGAGEVLDPAVAWAPLGVVLLARGGPLGLLGGGLLLATSASAWLAGLALLGVLLPALLRRPGPALALALAALPWILELSARTVGTSLLEPGAASEATARLEGTGEVLGALGLGSARTWGGPLLLGLLLAPWAPRWRWRALALAGLGAAAALGPVLVLEGTVVTLGERGLPLPLVLVDGLPPLSLVRDLAALGLLCWAGLALVLAEATAERPLALGLLALLLLGPRLEWTAAPAPVPTEASGPVLHYPFEQSPWTLLAQVHHGQPVSSGIVGPEPALEALVRQASWTPRDLQEHAVEAGFAELHIDATAVHGQALELAGVLGGHEVPVAAAPPWPTIILREHAFDNAQPIPPLPDSPPPDLGRDWTAVDPVLAPLMDEALLARALTRIQVYTSADGGETWAPLDHPELHSLTTLGLTVVRDEEGRDRALVVSGLSDFAVDAGPRARGTHPATVVALTTPDLARWGLRRFELDQPLAVVDPQLDWRDGRFVLTTWTSDRLGVDPMLLAGEHEVVEAELDRTGRMTRVRTLHAAPRLADPTRAGELLLYTHLDIGEQITESVRIVRPPAGEDADGATAEELAVLEGVSVPFAWRGPAGDWRLLAHGDASRVLGEPASSGFVVVEARSEDAVSWGPFRAVQGLGPRPCESPVAEVFQGTPVLVCSERLGLGGGAP